MIIAVETIKFWVINFQREHGNNLPTSTQLQVYINDSHDVDVKRVYSRVEISRLLSDAVKQGVLCRIKKDGKLTWGVTMAAKPANRKVVKEHKVWDGKLEILEIEEMEQDIWEPDKPQDSKDFWDGSKEDMWKVEVTD